MAQNRTLTAKEIIADIRAGKTDEFLMAKYGVSERALQSLFKKLISVTILTQDDIDNRASGATKQAKEPTKEAQPPGPLPNNANDKQAPTVAWRCPACQMPQMRVFDECPECGVIVARFSNKKTQKTPADTEVKESTESNEALTQTSKDSSLYGVLDFLKVPKNAAIVGVLVFFSVIIVAGYKTQGKNPQRRRSADTSRNYLKTTSSGLDQEIEQQILRYYRTLPRKIFIYDDLPAGIHSVTRGMSRPGGSS